MRLSTDSSLRDRYRRRDRVGGVRRQRDAVVVDGGRADNAAPQSSQAAPMTAATDAANEAMRRRRRSQANWRRRRDQDVRDQPAAIRLDFQGLVRQFIAEADRRDVSARRSTRTSASRARSARTLSRVQAKVALADATDKNGDIEKYNGKTFPPTRQRHDGRLRVRDQSKHANHQADTVVNSKTVLQYVITDAKGLPGKNCGAALLHEQRRQVAAGPIRCRADIPSRATRSRSAFTKRLRASSFRRRPVPLYFAVNCFISDRRDSIEENPAARRGSRFAPPI